MLKGWNAQAAANLGRTYVALHRSEEALAPLEQALAGTPDPEYAADARFAFTQALAELGHDPGRARTLAGGAKDILESLGTLTPLQRAKHDEVVDWLRRHV